jgi:hypothetical protein
LAVHTDHGGKGKLDLEDSLEEESTLWGQGFDNRSGNILPGSRG